MSVDPESALCHNNLGSALAVGAPSNPITVAEAETHLRGAIALRPERDEAYNNLGWTLALQGRFSEAIPLLRRVLRQDQSPDGARRDLALALDGEAEALRRQGNAAEAERLRQEAIEARAAMPTAKRPVENLGRDRETARP